MREQAQIQQVLNEGYLKRNTLFPNNRMNGYVHLDFEEVSEIELNINLKGVDFNFFWVRQVLDKSKFTNPTSETIQPRKKSEEELYIYNYVVKGNYSLQSYKNVTDVKLGDLVKYEDNFGKIFIGYVTRTSGKDVYIKYFGYDGTENIKEVWFKYVDKVIVN